MSVASEFIAQELAKQGFCHQGGFSIDGFWQVYKQQEMMNRSYHPSGQCAGELHLLCCEETLPHMQQILNVNSHYSNQGIHSALVTGEHNSMLQKNNVAGIADYLLSLVAVSES